MKKRSPLYPAKTMNDARDFSVSVFEKVGETLLKYADLAKHGGVPIRDADTIAVSSAQYGFMTQVRGKGYSAKGDVCSALRLPKNDDEKKKLYLTAFTSPAIYKTIATLFNGKKITEQGLIIDLVRDHEFSDPGAKSAAKVFFENASFLGLINDDGIFNLDAEIKFDPITPKSKKTSPSSQTGNAGSKKNSSEKIKHKADEFKSHTPALGGSNGLKKVSIFVRGQELQWSVPEDVNQSDWNTMIKQLENIKSFSK